MAGFGPLSVFALIALASLAEIALSLSLPTNFDLDLGEKLLKKSKRDLTDEDTQKLLSHSNTLSRQVMLQQLFVEERIRSDGSSGIKQCRLVHQGLKSYQATSYTGGSVAAIHEHSNNDRTCGLGELIVVLNGVEFRTRHNDYRLVMPSTTSDKYRETEDIPFPEVPPAVSEKTTVPEQVRTHVLVFTNKYIDININKTCDRRKQIISDKNTKHSNKRPIKCCHKL